MAKYLRGGGGGLYFSRQCWIRGVPRPPSPSRPRSRPLSRPRPHRSTIPLPLPRIGCIKTGVDDTGGLMDGPCEEDAS